MEDDRLNDGLARYQFYGVDVRPLVAVGLLATVPMAAWNKYSPAARADGITATQVDERLTLLREKHLEEHEDWTHEVIKAVEKSELRLEQASNARDLRQQVAIDRLQAWQREHQFEERELLQEKAQAETQLANVARRLERIEKLLENMRAGMNGGSHE